MMGSAVRRRLIFLVGLTLIAFLMVFQPIRLARGEAETVLQDSFTYELRKPVVEPGDDRAQRLEQKRNELLRKLREANPADPEWIDAVVVLSAPTQLRVDTVILPGLKAKEQSEQYGALILQTLKKEFPGVTELKPKHEADEESGEQPAATFWRFNVYRPIPHINLGLDLRGGLHLVLQCLPSTTFPFETDEDHLLLPEMSADEFETAAAELQQELKNELLTAFQQRGVAVPRRLAVNVMSKMDMEVSTVAETREETEAQEQVVRNYLEERFPTISMGDPERLLLERDTAEKVKNIIERRINALGVAESTIEIQGGDRLIVEIPGTKTAERVERIVDSRALLEFRLVPEHYKLDETQGFARGERRIWRDGDATSGPIVSEKTVMGEATREALGRDLKPKTIVVPDYESPGSWAVRFELKNERKQAFHAMTRKAVGQHLAIMLDGKVQMAPVIKSALPGGGVITGKFSDQEAKELALLLNAGALPVPIEIVENRTISATLGADSINKSARAGIIGFVVVLAFMILWYRLPGVIANVALAIYMLLVLAVYSFIGAVLTLPGIAGFILSIGMAVDANIIIFERLKEELATAKTMRSAVEAGFNRAWTAILDANVTTLIVAAVLYYFGTGPIRGFAVVLGIGVSCSLFTAITATRWMITVATTSKLGGLAGLFQTGLGSSGETSA